jgi:hypothetical protein
MRVRLLSVFKLEKKLLNTLYSGPGLAPLHEIADEGTWVHAGVGALYVRIIENQSGVFLHESKSEFRVHFFIVSPVLSIGAAIMYSFVLFSVTAF